MSDDTDLMRELLISQQGEIERLKAALREIAGLAQERSLVWNIVRAALKEKP